MPSHNRDEPSAERSRSAVWVNIALLLGTVVFVFALLEISIRVMLNDEAVQELPWPFVDENVQRQLRWQARYANRTPAKQYGFDLHDPLLGWRLRPNVAVCSVKAPAYDVMVHSNPQGLRGAAPVSMAKPTGVTRIGVFGCSLTFGEGVQEDETYSAQLAALLPGTEILNFGVHGYGTDQMLLRYETEGRKYQLDIAILAFAWFHMPRNLHHFHFFAKPTYELLPTATTVTAARDSAPDGIRSANSV